MTDRPEVDWQGHALGLLAVGAIGWLFEATNAFPGNGDANWAAPLALYLVSAAGLHLVRRIRGAGRGRAGLSTGEMAAERLAEVEARLLEVDALQARVAELEERLEFAERLLAPGSGPARPQELAR